jgi:hypothetical protein
MTHDPDETALRVRVFEKVSLLLPPKARTSTVSILARQGGCLTQHGTGTLIRIATDHFVITAAHVVAQSVAAKVPLVLGALKGNLVTFEAEAFFSGPSSSEVDDDHADVAACRLSRTAVSKLPSTTTFLGLDSVSFDDDLSYDLYGLVGFPTEWTCEGDGGSESADVTAKGLEYILPSFEGDASAFPNYYSGIHLLLDSSSDNTVDENGRPPSRPRSFKGISGTAIWRLFALAGPEPRCWQEGQGRIAAVETSVYHSGRVIKGTRWRYVEELICRELPHLRPTFSLWRAGGL